PAHEEIGNNEAEHAISEKLQPFVRLRRAGRRAGMGERDFQQLGPGKVVADLAGKLVRTPRPVVHYSMTWNRRLIRMAGIQRQNRHHPAVPSVEKKMISARPTKFSAGT